MARTEVTLSLRYPGTSYALQRLQQSFLECVVEYKSGSETELQTKLPADLFSKYQLKGAATVTDDEIVIQFTPRHSGVHCARLFADTREVCRPVPFLVTQSGETTSIPPDRPVRKPPTWESAPAPELARTPAFYGLNNPRFPTATPQSVVSDATTAAQTEPHHPEDGADHVHGGYTSDPEVAAPEQKRLFVGERSGFSPPRRMGFVSSGTRPHSEMLPEAAPLMPSSASPQHHLREAKRFDELYSSKKAGGRAYGTRRGPLSIDYQSVLTAETLRMLSKEADLQMKIFRGGKVKKRCDICSKKVKATKLVSLGEEDYCDPCFRRQFLLRSSIDHFMVPCVQECTVQVPINKRATKFITARKTIANVNLRGLEPSDVRNAHGEFQKFDMENNGWIQKAVLMPVLKACLSQSGVHDRESMFLLNSQALQSMISSYGLEERGEIHEIEFLGLYAFLARERERLHVTNNPRSSSLFTRNDLEMAYAFHQQMTSSKGVGGAHLGKQGMGGWEGSFAPQQRGSYFVPQSATQSTFDQQRGGYSSISPSPSDMAAIQMSSPPRRQQMGDIPESMQQLFPSRPRPQRQSVAHSEHIPLGDRLAARRAATKRLSVVSGGGGGETMDDLAEEDQEDDDNTLFLPPDKDPATQQRTNSLIGKTPGNKRLMADVNKELKLTGGEADGWMLY